jgi:hypothetical protein
MGSESISVGKGYFIGSGREKRLLLITGNEPRGVRYLNG